MSDCLPLTGVSDTRTRKQSPFHSWVSYRELQQKEGSFGVFEMGMCAPHRRGRIEALISVKALLSSAWKTGLVTEHMPSLHKALGLVPSPIKNKVRQRSPCEYWHGNLRVLQWNTCATVNHRSIQRLRQGDIERTWMKSVSAILEQGSLATVINTRVASVQGWVDSSQADVLVKSPLCIQEVSF